MKLIHISLATALCIKLSFAFSLDDVTKLANDTLKKTQETTTQTKSTQSDSMITKGLKEALSKGVQSAVDSLSKDNGYFNSDAKIALPESLSSSEALIRKAGAGKYADDLIKAMNSAASQAAPKTAPIFLDAIQKMGIDDANKVLQGSNSAATQYFKDNTYNKLKDMIAPIIKNSIASNDVAKYYNAFNSAYKTYGKDLVESSGVMGYAKSFGVDKYIPSGEDKSLDEYITSQALDGLFEMIQKEEMAIRENPVNRTTDLLKQVFK